MLFYTPQIVEEKNPEILYIPPISATDFSSCWTFFCSWLLQICRDKQVTICPNSIRVISLQNLKSVKFFAAILPCFWSGVVKIDIFLAGSESDFSKCSWIQFRQKKVCAKMPLLVFTFEKETHIIRHEKRLTSFRWNFFFKCMLNCYYKLLFKAWRSWPDPGPQMYFTASFVT